MIASLYKAYYYKVYISLLRWLADLPVPLSLAWEKDSNTGTDSC